MFASFSASIWAWARTNLFFFGDLLGRCIVFARSVYPCSHCSPCPVVSCLLAVPFAMACYLWLLLVAVFVSPVLSMYPSRSRKQTHGWRDRGGYGGWQGSQDRSGLHGRLDKLEMLVEEAVKGKKKKKRSKKKSSSSSSPSSSPNDKKARKQKRDKKSKSEPRRSEGSSGTLSAEEKKELLEFRRQAEMDKLRAEVRAAVEAERAAPGHKASSPKLPRTDRTSSADPLTPKTCRVIVAESKIFQENGVKQLLSDPSSCSSWQNVSDQLSALPVAEVKALLKQFCPNEQLPRSRQEIVRDVVAQLQLRSA